LFKANRIFLMCAIFTGKNLIKLNEVDSTNSYLSELASKEKLADGTVVIAQHQYAGKGKEEMFGKQKKIKISLFPSYIIPVMCM
jgi:BirA family biotin operon repressor/biotin-[acetyl-CoA-carboxylase] ligase